MSELEHLTTGKWFPVHPQLQRPDFWQLFKFFILQQHWFAYLLVWDLFFFNLH